MRHWKSGKPHYIEELEGEHARMREAGMPVPRKSLQEARSHIRWAIDSARASGAKRIDPKAIRFAEEPAEDEAFRIKTFDAITRGKYKDEQ